MTLRRYYVRALWAPLIIPAVLGLGGLLYDNVTHSSSGISQFGMALATGIPVYVILVIPILWQIRAGRLSDERLEKIGLVLPLVGGLVAGLAAVLLGSELGGGVVLAALVIFFGYCYVGIIELVKAALIRAGLINRTTDSPIVSKL